MIEWVTNIVAAGGWPGVLALMFLENLFPPIPSELIMPLAGYLAAEGRLSVWAVVAAGTTGSVLGALFWYALGRAIGPVRFLALVDRYGRWLTLTRPETLAAIHWFERHGAAAVFLGRMVPGVRTLISIPAGLAGMPFGRFLLFTFCGSLIWVSGLTLAGYLLQAQYERVHVLLDPATTILVVMLAVIYVWRVLRWRRQD